MTPTANPPAASFEQSRQVARRSGTLGLSLLVTVLIVLLMIAGRVPEALLSRYAYAVESGQIKADSEHLAKADELSNVFRMVAKVAGPGVVQIRVRGIEPTLKVRLERDYKLQQGKISALRRELEADPDSVEKQAELLRAERQRQELFAELHREGSGSGIIIDPSGYILTNNHVVEAGSEYDVSLLDRRTYSAKLIGTDPKTDIALVKIEADDLHALSLGDSDKMEVGDWVLAVGAPFGLSNTVTHGIISAKGRTDINTGRDTSYKDFMQTDAAINPGNSGGPLLNLRGEVIGINTAIATTEGVNAGVAFTIPSNQAAKIVRQLRDTGQVARGWLGIRMADISNEDAKKLGLTNADGVLVDVIYEGSPADKAGLQVEDVIVELNGHAAEDLTHLRLLVADVTPGDKASAVVWRDGAKQTIDIQVDRQPTDIDAYSSKSHAITTRPIARLGIDARTIAPRALGRIARMDAGVFVVRTKSNQLNVLPGERIIGCNDHEIRTVGDLQDALAHVGASNEVTLQVVGTDGDKRTIVQTLP